MKLTPAQTARTRAPEFFWQVVFIHIMVFAVAPFFFSWQRLAFGFGLAMLTGHAVGMFHHMLLTHQSFKVARPLTYLGSLLGTLSWRGPMAAPVRYVAMHRIHHIYSDQEADPHSPVHGYWHALLGWFWWLPQVFLKPEEYRTIAGHVGRDPFLNFLDRHVNLLQAIYGIILFALGGLVPVALHASTSFDWENATAILLYGVFVKSIFVIYLSNLVDVINHSIGYRNYETEDLSTNSSLMGVIHLGGAISWHNNHHAHPGYFRVKKQWWEIDVHYAALKLLETIGLASDIKTLDESQEVEQEVVA
jgi:stearoyl-CoA desaturase (delta-9 desaturase)